MTTSMKPFAIAVALLLLGPRVTPGFTIAEGGRASCALVLDVTATAPEKHAAKELAQTLKQITGAEFAVAEDGLQPPATAILIGPGVAAKALFPEIPFDQLG